MDEFSPHFLVERFRNAIFMKNDNAIKHRITSIEREEGEREERDDEFSHARASSRWCVIELVKVNDVDHDFD